MVEAAVAEDLSRDAQGRSCCGRVSRCGGCGRRLTPNITLQLPERKAIQCCGCGAVYKGEKPA